MENYLFSLKSFIATCMSSSSTPRVIETILGFVCGVGLFLLLLPFLQSNPSLPPPEKKVNIRTLQVETRKRSRKRNKREAVKACRSSLKALQEARGLISLLQNHMGKPPDNGSIHQQSCQDSCQRVGKRVPADAQQPCVELPEGAASLESVVSPCTFAAPPTQTPRPLTFALSPDLMIPCVSAPSPSLHASPPPEPPLPVDSFSPPPLALPAPLPDPPVSGCLQASCLQAPATFPASPLPEATLTPSQCDSVAMTVPPSCVPGIPFPDNCWLTSIPVFTGLDTSSHPTSTISGWELAAKAQGLSTSKYSESQQEQTSCHPQESAFGEGHTDRSTGTSNPTFPNPDIQKFLEIQVTKSTEFKIWEEKEQDRFFPNQMSSGYHLNSLRNMLKSPGDEQDTTVSQSLWSTKRKIQQQLSYCKTLDHIPQKCSQLFWGLPFLHSESLAVTVTISGSTLEFPSVLFNGISNALPVQMQAKGSPLVSQPQFLPHAVAYLQPLILTMSQSEVPPLAQVQTHAHLQSSLRILPSSPPQFRACEVSCLNARSQAQSLISTKIQHLEWPLLQELGSGKALPSVIKRSQEAFSPLSPNLSQNTQVRQAHKSDSTLPGDFVNPELRKLLEQHLQKRLIHHQCGLPSRIQKFLKLAQPRVKLPRLCQANDQNGPLQPSIHKGESSEEVKKVASGHQGRSRHPGSFHVCDLANFHPGRNLSKDLGHSPGKVPKYNISQRSRSSLVKVLGVDSKKEPKNDSVRYSQNYSGNCILPRGPRETLEENTLKVHLDRKSRQIAEDQIPMDVRQSRLATNCTLLKSDTYTKTRNLMSPEGRACHVNTIQELSFLNQGTQQALETHVVRFWAGHKWRLPLKVLKPVNLFKTRKGNTLPFLQPNSPSSTPHESLAESRADAVKFLEENFQAGWEEKVTTGKPVPILASSSPVSSPADVEVQRLLMWSPPDNDNRPSKAPQSGQDGRQPLQSFTSGILGRPLHIGTTVEAQRGSLELTPSPATAWKVPREESVGYTTGGRSPSVTVLERSCESQSSGDEETRKALRATGSSVIQLQDRDILRTSVLANSQNTNVSLKSLGASGTSEIPPPSRMSSQDPGQPCSQSQAVSEFELKMKSVPEDQPQGHPSEMPLQDYATKVLLAADNLVGQISQSHPQSVFSEDAAASEVLYDLKAVRRSSLRQQESKIPDPQDPWKSQSKISASTDEETDYRRPKPGESEEGLAGLGPSESCGVNYPSQVKGIKHITESKYLQKLPEKGQAPPEGPFRKTMKHFLQWIFPSKKDKENNDRWQKGKPVPSSHQSHAVLKSRLVFTDKGTTEAQALMRAVGQILKEKTGLQCGVHPSKLSQQKEEIQESQALVGRHFSYCHRAPSCLKHRRMMNDLACHYHAIPEAQSGSVQELQNRDQNPLKITGFHKEKLCMRHSALLSPREIVTSVSSQQHGPRMWAASGHTHHCPRHCLQEYVLSGQLEHASAALLSGKTSIQENNQSMPRSMSSVN